ncbi:methionine-R-sulfoxide reductase B2 [Niveomyces insectorum RCEF 264]|uniref:Peptide-methionine (R)-S-oxide reductase n=1 Tax=Niveomyces insectorum RCEF 264 TaxID=1081102 RepID=A0A167TYR2_9HYPO|nr:methionine-R-sulfoxide reductase B2 [Niveomyces insectorum RCEF 264]
MRFPRLSAFLPTYTAFTSFGRCTWRRSPQLPPLPPSSSQVVLRSMPSIPFFGSFFSSSSSSSDAAKKDTMTYPDQRSTDEWRAVLNPQQFRILREKGTEAPFSGAYDKHFADAGVYRCAGCDAPLYKADHKFKSGCGWPAYFDSLPGAVKRYEDRTLGVTRTEIVCANCGGHLGHVFKGEGYPTPTDERHCVNSISLKFSPEDAPATKKNGKNGVSSKA